MRNFFKKLVSVLLYLSVESLDYSNLYEHFRTKLQDFIKRNWRQQRYDYEQFLLFGEVRDAGRKKINREKNLC